MTTLNHVNSYSRIPDNYVQTRQKEISRPLNEPDISSKNDFTLSSGLKVSVATKKDAYNLASFFSSIENEEFNRFVDIEFQAKWLNDNMENGGLIHVIRDGPQIVGSVSVSPLRERDMKASIYSKPISPRTAKRVGLIYCVYLARHLRGQKNGFELMKHVIEDAKAMGYKKLILFTRNPIAKHRYITLGFKEINKDNLKGFKKGLWFPKDTTWMELNIKSLDTVA